MSFFGNLNKIWKNSDKTECPYCGESLKDKYEYFDPCGSGELFVGFLNCPHCDLEIRDYFQKVKTNLPENMSQELIKGRNSVCPFCKHGPESPLDYTELLSIGKTQKEVACCFCGEKWTETYEYRDTETYTESIVKKRVNEIHREESLNFIMNILKDHEDLYSLLLTKDIFNVSEFDLLDKIEGDKDGN
jgi:uncharacterized Zn-finger protein